jgi:hypothetical protein
MDRNRKGGLKGLLSGYLLPGISGERGVCVFPGVLFNITQLPLDPPVLTGFLAGPAALVPGLAMNLELPPIMEPLLFFPGLPLFLLFTGNDITNDFSAGKIHKLPVDTKPPG